MANNGRVVGRDREQRRMRELLDDVSSGHSLRLALVGEPGVGKTVLLDDLARTAADNGFLVLTTAGRPSEAPVAFEALSELVWPVRDRVADRPGRPGSALAAAVTIGSGVASDLLAIGTAVLDLLAALAETRPVLLVVDDAHWLDPASAQVLTVAALRLDAEAVGLVCAARDPDTPLVDISETLSLSGVDLETARQLVASVGLGEAEVAALHRDTAGNPLALLEIAPLVAERGDWPHVPLPIGDRIRRAFVARLEGLSADTRRALVVAAADRTGRATAAALEADGTGVRALHEAEMRGFVHVGAGAVTFRHPILRAASYREATPAQRRAAHLLLARIEADVEAATWHRVAAAVGPDPDLATKMAEVAARNAARGAHAEAGMAWRRAATLAVDPGDVARLRVASARALEAAGDLDGCLAVLDTPLDADPFADAEAEHLRARVAVWRGDPLRLRDLLLARADRIEDDNPHEAARLCLDAVIPCIVGGATASALVPARRAAQTVGADHPLVQLALGIAATEECREAEARPHLLRAADGLATLDPVEHHLAVAFGALALGVHRCLGQALSLAEHLVAAAGARNMPGRLPFALAVAAILHFWAGSWDRAAATGDEAVELAAAVGHPQAVALVFSSYVLASRGEDAPCTQRLDRAELLIGRTGEHALACWRHAALGRLALTRARPDVAATELEMALASDPPGAMPDWTGDLVDALAQDGRIGAAQHRADQLAGWARVNRDDLGHGLVNRSRLAWATTSEVDDLVAEGTAHLEAVGDPFAKARLALAAGERLRRDRRLVDARGHLARAIRGFQSLGTPPWVDRAERELRASGGAPAPRSPRALEGLTSQELQVALVVAAGATNREAATRLVVSPKTVAYHLNNVYRKLGLRSRTELARTVAHAEAPRTPRDVV